MVVHEENTRASHPSRQAIKTILFFVLPLSLQRTPSASLASSFNRCIDSLHRLTSTSIFITTHRNHLRSSLHRMTQAIEEFEYEALPENASLSASLLAGAFAGIAEHAIMYPVDSIKVRLSPLANESGYRKCNGTLCSIFPSSPKSHDNSPKH